VSAVNDDGLEGPVWESVNARPNTTPIWSLPDTIYFNEDDTLYLENQVTGIGDDQGSLLTPTNYNLAQNYPNPFNPVTTIQYSLTQRSNVTLKVYDVLGKEIAVLVNEEKDRGVYNVNFDATGLASGMYMYRIQAGSFAETKKMILLR